jgi:hypothetical protein
VEEEDKEERPEHFMFRYSTKGTELQTVPPTYNY